MEPLPVSDRMIDFACRCSHRFSLPEDQAGGVIQCPQCHRLVDIPSLSDLTHIDQDGNYKFEGDIIPLAEPDRLDTLRRSFTRAHREDDGREIDLRPSMRDVMQAGSEEMPYELADEVHPAPPKYDPVTGELVRVLDVKPPEHPEVRASEVPMAKRAVQYAMGDITPGVGIWGIGLKLLEPVNLFVMSIIVFIHLLVQPVNIMMLAGFFLVIPLWIIGIGFILAHYGNVVDETGPAEKDELPRPLRDAQLYDDIWHPFTFLAGTIMICYGPVLLAWRFGLPGVAMIMLAIVGTIFVPAVLLTLATSGTVANARPDRLLGVIGGCGVEYWISLGILIVGATLYALGLWRFQIDTAMLFLPRRLSGFSASVPWWFEPWIAYPAFFMGIHMMHWFCWSLGAMYRAHHDRFPWIMQRHISTRLAERTQLPPAADAVPAATPAADRRGNTNSATVKRRLRQ
jgi:hypothetical protein